MKIEIATWEDPEDVQSLIDDFNKENNLDIKMISFEYNAGTYFATIQSDRLTENDAFQLGKKYAFMIKDMEEKGLL